jgi:hypothetical protein
VLQITKSAVKEAVSRVVLATFLIRHNYGSYLADFSMSEVSKRPFSISQPASAIQERTIIQLNSKI